MPRAKQQARKKEVSEILDDASKTYKQRSELYGDGYKRIGHELNAFFPEGITLSSPNDFSRFYSFVMSVAKLNRYANNIESGGHEDSAHDAVVYTAMLEHFTVENEND